MAGNLWFTPHIKGAYRSGISAAQHALEDRRIPGQRFRSLSSEPLQGQYPPQRTHRPPLRGGDAAVMVDKTGCNVAVGRHCAITNTDNRPNLPHKGVAWRCCSAPP